MTQPNSANGDPEQTRDAKAASSSESVRMIGAYSLIQKIGEGGMGEVWLAEQKQPVVRRVALKIIRAGMDTKHIVARFETERQALAMMNHPSIASIFDGGTTPDGHPYFVMEYVSGQPITEYCNRHRLPVKVRLRLFQKVCDGVQHAHQKAIIHRDLKPSNILVSDHGGEVRVKIIDFGLAKATGAAITQNAAVTQYGVFLGTPEYMSPEQADFSTEDIDTRSDIYSLGVLLYNLLTGTMPIPADDMRDMGVDAIRNLIRNRQPQKPSTCVSKQGDKSRDTAELRMASPRSLQSELSGDLDWITMKALEKDRARRYGTAQAFSDDVERFLSAQPIIARPPSRLYELGRFARRHKTTVTALAVVTLALTAGGITAAVGFLRASEAERQARLEAEKARKVSQFLFTMLQDASPFAHGRADWTLTDIVSRALPRINQELAEEPEISGQLRLHFANVYWGFGDSKTAIALFRQSMSDFERHFGGANIWTESARQTMCWTLIKVDSVDETIVQTRIGIDMASQVEGERSLLLARYLDLLGSSYWTKGELDSAELYTMEACEMFRQLTGAVPNDIQNDLALVWRSRGKWAEAEASFRHIYENNCAVVGELHPQTLLFAENLATTFEHQKRYREAEIWYARVYEGRLKVLGAQHPFTQYAQRCLQWVRGEMNKSTTTR